MTVESTADAGTRLWWGVRHYWWLVAASIAVVTVLGTVAPVNAPLSDEREYQVEALVVAQELTIRAEQLPRLAEAVFSSGSVAERALATPGAPDDIAPADFIPKHVRLDPLSDTIALRVVGVDEEPAVAADLANRTADAFVDELNGLGPGVGVFALQDRARAANATLTSRGDSPLLPLVLGLVGGLALGLGLVILLTAIRRPVLLPQEAAALAGAPVLASLSIPQHPWSRLPAPEAVGGLAALVRQLLPDSTGAAALVATGRRLGPSGRLAALVSQILAGRPRLVAPGAGRSRLQELVPDAEILAHVPRVAPDRSDPPLLVVASATQFDVPQLLPRGTRAAIVVQRGCPESAVQRAAAQFVPGDLTGVVLVAHGGWHWSSPPPPSIAPAEPLALEAPRDPTPVRPVQQAPTSPPADIDDHDDVDAESVDAVHVVLVKPVATGGTALAGLRVLLERSLGEGRSEPVAELVTGDDGSTAPTPVPPGTYRVQELDATNGHRPRGPWTFIAGADDIGFDLVVELTAGDAPPTH